MGSIDALFLIAPVIGGYLFAKEWEVSKLEVAREDGHKLYFRAVAYGINLFIVVCMAALVIFETSQFVFSLVTNWPVDRIFFNVARLIPGDEFIRVCALLTFWVGWGLPHVLNSFCASDSEDSGSESSKKSSYLREKYREFVQSRFWKALESRPLELLWARANEAKQPVAFTLENGLVFIGFWKNSPVTADKNIQILPVASGARRSDGKLDIRTVYEEIYQELEGERYEHLTTDSFLKVIDGSKVIAANMFDTDAYLLFQESEVEGESEKILPPEQ